MEKKKKVLVIGGGFGGVYAAKALERQGRGRDLDELREPVFLDARLGGMDALLPRGTDEERAETVRAV